MSTAFCDLEDLRRRLEQALAASPADETELVCFERCRATARGGSGGGLEAPLRSVLVRVVEGRRLGWYRSDASSAGELENAVRLALSLAKLEPRLKPKALFPQRGEKTFLDHRAKLHDPAVEHLDPAAASQHLEALSLVGEDATLRWSRSRLVIANSHGLWRSASATEVSLAVATGRHAGAGHAAAASRSLAGLDLLAVFERARRVAADATAGCAARAAADNLPGPRGQAVPALLAPEATIALLDVINLHAFSGRAFLDGSSVLSRHCNVQVFDRRFHLRDDGSAVEGLAFPFDFEGGAKRPLELIVAGTPSTPALSRHQAQLAGLAATGRSVGGSDTLFGNLFVLPGEADEDALLAAADGGVFLGWLEKPVCLDPLHLRIRAIARGVRRIENGALGAPLPTLVWEDSLLRVLARLEAVGRRCVVRAMATTPLGAISAPALALTAIEGLQVARDGVASG